MLARLQQLFVLILVGTTTLWIWYFWPRGLRWALSMPVFALVGYSSAIAFEFVLLARSYLLAKSRPPFLALLTAWCREIWTAPQVFLWRQPFRWHALQDDVRADNPPRPGILLVHGFLCNRGIWNPWLRRLRAARVSFIALSLEPVFGSIDSYVAAMECAAGRLQTVTGLPPIIVAHSMGGLAARAWLARHGGAGRVHRVVTIGTPHQGTAMARHAHFANGRQMRKGSAWIASLAASEAADAYAAFTCFWSRCDNIVFPTESATLPGADNRQLDATPHVRMVYHPDIFAEVMRLVDHERQKLPAPLDQAIP